MLHYVTRSSSLASTSALRHYQRCTFASFVNDSPIRALHNDEPHSKHELPHPIWNLKEIEKVEATHVAPKGAVDKLAYFAVQFTRKCFDLFTGYSFGIKGESMNMISLCY